MYKYISGSGYCFLIRGVLMKEENMKKYQEQLENLVLGCTYELMETNKKLQQEIMECRRAEETIKELNDILQRRVLELDHTNKELESFNFSVSHDLRNYLRGIDGFSLALLEDYSDQLDERGKEYLYNIRQAARCMERYIQDLVNLSKGSLFQLFFEEIDLSNLVEEIAKELQRLEPGRKARFIITPGLAATGDKQLLRIALENLLDNAWKFTGKQPETLIEFGITRNRNVEAFFLRDNGAGFDMAYLEKLFQPFQRLHALAEFPGTGIGLATVQRIIRRHGGDIWAQGEVGKGAMFYFTLK